jgi:hypothetical protein
MIKPFILFQGPVATRSGYGAHARDIVLELLKTDKYDIKIGSLRWGNTPMNALNEQNPDHKLILDNLIFEGKLDKQPDLHIQLTVPNEFQQIGKKNLGITAGLEATAIPKKWIDGLNRMDLNIVPAEFVKEMIEQTKYEEKQGKEVVGVHGVNKPIKVLFEGYDEKIYGKTNKFSPELVEEFKKIRESFCFLFTGHWLSGNLTQDRKDVGMLIKTFLETFKNKGKKKRPALILKTSSATTSVIDREDILKKIKQIKDSVEAKIYPSIYLLHGDLEDEEMNELYNHPKVKVHVTFTHGEGFGRPLLEASLSAKPIIFSAWSGHLDFLPPSLSTALEGSLVKVPKNAFPKEFFVDGMAWFGVNYSKASKKMKDVFENYKKYTPIFNQLAKSNKVNFTRSKMGVKLIQTVDGLIGDTPKQVNLKLPKLKKISGGQTGAIKPPKMKDVIKLPKLRKM